MVGSRAAAFLSLRLRLLAFGEILRLASIGSLRMTQKMLGALRASPKIFIHHPGYTLSFLCKGLEGVWGTLSLKGSPCIYISPATYDILLYESLWGGGYGGAPFGKRGAPMLLTRFCRYRRYAVREA